MLPELEFKLWLSDFFKSQELNSDEISQFNFFSFNRYDSGDEKAGFTIYEDWWIKNPEIVKSKIKSILKLNSRIAI